MSVSFKSINSNFRKGRFGPYGGMYVPEVLMSPLFELEEEFTKSMEDKDFNREFNKILTEYAGRPTPLTEVSRYSAAIGGGRIFLKREDLLHTGAHKINNAMGQALLARRMGKRRIIAETGAGQHGVATATAAARLGLECTIYMGKLDAERQSPNVYRMRLLGAEIKIVEGGSGTLKDAVNQALRDWAETVEYTHYVLGSALGPHPFPLMVKYFHSCIGREARKQILDSIGKLPEMVVACVGGGSNSIGIFSGFINDHSVRLVGVEAGGRSDDPGEHAARFKNGRPGVLHGMYTYLLQDENGQVLPTHSISAGLDYPAVGPEHSWLKDKGRVEYTSVRDEEALREFHRLTELEGILPALESSHALAFVVKVARNMKESDVIIVNLSGRGDKDVDSVSRLESRL